MAVPLCQAQDNRDSCGLVESHSTTDAVHSQLRSIDRANSRRSLSPFGVLFKDTLYRFHGILSKVAILRLNGGLGTTMGCSGPKSLLPVRRCGERTYSFLDVVLLQVEASSDGLRSTSAFQAQRRHYGVSVPLLLMNSHNTHKATLEQLATERTDADVRCFEQ